ncbi:MAG: Gfo/Idh/MocA family oxidoreductase [Planctomycetes bacterium]|nr:Gfo/Idh/MocA family oxidoreductase [Planctomycetota bacterium]
MLRVGIAGLGFMGMIHYHAFGRIPGVRVDAISTRDPKKLAGDWTGIQGNFGPRGTRMDLSGVRTYPDLDAMLADPKLDLIDVTLPTERHLDVTLAALKAGKHVLVEKPIALQPAEGRRMAAAARKARRKLLVAHVLPFFPEYAAAYKLATSGRFGKLLGGHFKRIISRPDWSKAALDYSRSGGPAVDLHIHDTHYIRNLFGMPKAVFSRGVQAGGGVQYLTTQYIYADPGLTLSASSGAVSQSGRSFTHGFEIYLERGTLCFEWANQGGQPTPVMPLTLFKPDRSAERVKLGSSDPVEAFVGELKYAADALRGKHDGKLLAAEGALAALTLCHKEIESVRSGRVVKV